jgi:hypothetical protein
MRIERLIRLEVRMDQHVLRSTMLGAGLGAGLMFLFDPDRGVRRRSLVRDKVIRARHKTRDVVNATRRDFGNRMEGVAAELRGTGDTPDEFTLIERVRAKLGRVASQPRMIHVTASNGSITLSGDIFASEADAVVSAVRGVRGVCDVNNQLIVHRDDYGSPALQGHSLRSGRKSSRLVGGWSRTGIVIVATAAAAGIATVVAARQ